MNWKISTKLVIGFGAVIAIALTIGAFAVTQMKLVQGIANELEQSLAPASSAADSVKGEALLARLNTRTFGLTGTDESRQESLRVLDELRQSLKEAMALADRQDINWLRQNARDAETALREYSADFQAVIDARAEMRRQEEASRTNAAQFMDAAYAYIAAAEREIQDIAASTEPDVQAILSLNQEKSIVNKIIDQGNEIIIGTWFSIYRNDVDAFIRTKDRFRAIEDLLNQLRQLTDHSDDLRLIQQNETAARAYEANMARFLEAYQQREAGISGLADSGDRIQQAAVRTSTTANEESLEGTTLAAESLSTATTTVIFGLILGTALGIGIAILLSRSISVPLARISSHLHQMGSGDFSANVDSADAARGDEIGDLARSATDLTQQMRTIVADLSVSIETLSSASTELLAVADEGSRGSEDLNNRAQTVSAAAEELSANVANVAAGMEQTSTNLSSVASATEQMTATIGEIASNSEKARGTTEDAGRKVEDFSRLMRELGHAAQEIGKVTETISGISDQTNLLALNATIEAARAGAAGKGFAVVANEIKELAQQTAEATEEIKGKISSIQESSGNAVEDVGNIVRVMREVSEIVTSIAASVEEQSSVTREVAANINEATRGVQDSNERMSESSRAVSEVTSEITLVTSTASEIAEVSQQTNASARELSTLAEKIRASIAHFKV